MSLVLTAAPISLVKASTAVSEQTPASLKGMGGKAKILRVLYYLLSMDAIFNFC